MMICVDCFYLWNQLSEGLYEKLPDRFKSALSRLMDFFIGNDGSINIANRTVLIISNLNGYHKSAVLRICTDIVL